MKQKSWISIVFSFASQCRGKIALSVLCAIISVVAGLIPYWSVYQIITLFIGGSPVMAEVWKWCWIGLGAYAIRFLLYGISTSLSHISAYTILENIRLTLAQRLMKAPLGTVIGESVGRYRCVGQFPLRLAERFSSVPNQAAGIGRNRNHRPAPALPAAFPHPPGIPSCRCAGRSFRGTHPQ